MGLDHSCFSVSKTNTSEYTVSPVSSLPAQQHAERVPCCNTQNCSNWHQQVQTHNPGLRGKITYLRHRCIFSCRPASQCGPCARTAPRLHNTTHNVTQKHNTDRTTQCKPVALTGEHHVLLSMLNTNTSLYCMST